MFYLMVQMRDDWGSIVSYRIGKPIKTLTKAKQVCNKRKNAYIVNQNNVCIYVGSVNHA